MELGVSLSKNIYYSQPIFLLNYEKFAQEPLGYFLLVDMFHFPPSLLGDPIESNFWFDIIYWLILFQGL